MFKPFLVNALIYVDDIFLFSKDANSHEKLLTIYIYIYIYIERERERERDREREREREREAFSFE